VFQRTEHVVGGKSVFFSIIGSTLIVSGSLLSGNPISWSGVVLWTVSIMFSFDRILVDNETRTVEVISLFRRVSHRAEVLDVAFEDMDSFNERSDIWWLRRISGVERVPIVNLKHVAKLCGVVASLRAVGLDVPMRDEQIESITIEQRRWLLIAICGVSIATLVLIARVVLSIT
jgi:hypothetical protein